MPALSDKPKSSTGRQRQAIVLAAAKHGLDLAEVRRMVGGSVSALSAAQASQWIEKFSGRELANPPGGKRPPYTRRPRGRERGSPRMITAAHIEQIARLMLDYFDGNMTAAAAWFEKHWDCKEPRDLGTTSKAGTVINVLKIMLKRKAGAK